MLIHNHSNVSSHKVIGYGGLTNVCDLLALLTNARGERIRAANFYRSNGQYLDKRANVVF